MPSKALQDVKCSRLLPEGHNKITYRSVLESFRMLQVSMTWISSSLSSRGVVTAIIKMVTAVERCEGPYRAVFMPAMCRMESRCLVRGLHCIGLKGVLPNLGTRTEVTLQFACLYREIHEIRVLTAECGFMCFPFLTSSIVHNRTLGNVVVTACLLASDKYYGRQYRRTNP